MSLAESGAILMRFAAIKGMNLNTEVQKPSLADVLEFQGPRMDCTEESTPHPEARAYSSTYEGGEVMQQFEAEGPGAMDLQTTGEQQDMVFPLRAEGRYSSPTNPWPRVPETEERDMCRRENLPTRDKVQVIAGTSMVSPRLQRHTSRASK